MSDAKYLVETDTTTYRDLTLEEVETLVRERLVRPSDRLRDMSTGAESRLADHPHFARFVAGKGGSEEGTDEQSPPPVRQALDPAAGESTDAGGSTSDEQTAGSENRWMLVVLAVLLPGLPQFYLGQRTKGAVLFVVSIVTLYGAGIACVVSALDTFLMTSSRAGELVPTISQGRSDGVGPHVAAWCMAWAVGALSAWAWVGTTLWPGVFATQNDGRNAAVEEERTDEPTPECSDRHATCSVDGVEGRCVRGGWCMPAGPGCIHDVDCRDGNQCTRATCREGRCVLEPTQSTCELDDDTEGTCRHGVCEPTLPETCVDDSDCPSFENDCLSVTCGDKGQCQVQQADDGSSCTTTTDAPGTCRSGTCEMDAELASERRDIDCKTVRGLYGETFERCDKSLLFRLDDKKREEAREAIRDEIQEQMRYEVFVSLIALPNGGYNVITTNLRSRDRVQGLIDPSFVAFTMAGYTKGTGWRSRELQVWIRPYDEGWAIPTSGSRVAIEKGRHDGLLGSLGVVNVQEYRSWLQKNFYNLAAPSAFRTPPEPTASPDGKSGLPGGPDTD